MSTEIKSVIGLLCKQLNMMLKINLKPEYLRLAKFDKNEENVIPVLWTTLSLLTTKERTPDIEKIKLYMKLLLYDADLFYTLPEDCSSGSRELLLAIAFILAKNLRSMIQEEIKRSPFDESYQLINLDDTEVERPEIPEKMSENDMKNYLMWLKGRTQQNEKMTEEYDEQIAKIYEKLNSQLNTKATEKLTMSEILALSSKKYGKLFLERSAGIFDLLECYQEWTRKEKIFWKWMATVLAEREKKFYDEN